MVTSKVVVTNAGNLGMFFTGSPVIDVLDASFLGTLGTTGLVMVYPATPFSGTGVSIIGSAVADVLIGSSGNDVLQNVTDRLFSIHLGDVLTGGAGNDQFVLRGSQFVFGNFTSHYGDAPRITDFTVGQGSATDSIGLSTNASNYILGGVGVGGLKATVLPQGIETFQPIAANTGAINIFNASQDIVKLTSGVATAGLTLQAAFDAAIGTTSLVNAAANGSYFFTMYDSTNARMVIGLVDDSNGSATAIQAGDRATLVGSADMSASEYAQVNAGNFQFIA